MSEESQLRIRLDSALASERRIWQECQELTAERDALREEVARLRARLAARDEGEA